MILSKYFWARFEGLCCIIVYMFVFLHFAIKKEASGDLAPLADV